MLLDNLGRLRFQRRSEVKPVLYISQDYWIKLQGSVLARNGLRGNEQAFYILLKRVWQDGRPTFIMNEAFIPKYEDYAYQREGGLNLKSEYLHKVLRRVLQTNRHLLSAHTHPEGSIIRPSTADIQTARDWGLRLQAMPGQRQLIEGIFNHNVSLVGMYTSLYNGADESPLEVRQVEQLPEVTGYEYMVNGSLLELTHVCPHPLMDRMTSQQLGLSHSIVQAEVYGGNEHDLVPLDWPKSEVMIRIRKWSADCNCQARLQPGDIVSWDSLAN